MATSITALEFIDVFKTKGILFFTPYDIRKLFSIKSPNTLRHLLRRLKNRGIIKRLAQNRYLFLLGGRYPSDFEVANFLIYPSYISLETALSYYGSLSQFPFRISSITLNKPKEIKVGEKIFTYSRIKPEYFSDFIKTDNFLIATDKKAVFDYLYMVYKGSRSKSTLLEILPAMRGKEIKNYLSQRGDKQFAHFLKSYVK